MNLYDQQLAHAIKIGTESHGGKVSDYEGKALKTQNTQNPFFRHDLSFAGCRQSPERLRSNYDLMKLEIGCGLMLERSKRK